ncbi:MAG: hypothetical protein Q9227_008038 [Pyrenula ochraceoflavens]
MATFNLFSLLSLLALLLTTHLCTSTPLSRRAGVVPTLSGTPASMGPGTYPRATRLQDNSILGTFAEHNADGESIITVVRSTDNGGTWSHMGEVTRNDTATHDIDNPYLLQLSSGRVLVAFRNHDRQPFAAYIYFRIVVCYSDNGGADWVYLSTPEQHASTGSEPNGSWEPFMRIAGDGSLQIYYSRENNAGDQDSLMRTSTDQAVTWSDPSTVTGAEQPNSRDGMQGVATVTGSELIDVFETETGGGQFTIGAVSSSDDGKTWGNRRTIFTPSVGNANANAPQVVNVGGTLVVSLQTDEDNPGQEAMKIITSGDGGATWGNKLTVLQPVSIWPGLLTLDDSSLLGMADNGGAKSQKILLG